MNMDNVVANVALVAKISGVSREKFLAHMRSRVVGGGSVEPTDALCRGYIAQTETYALATLAVVSFITDRVLYHRLSGYKLLDICTGESYNTVVEAADGIGVTRSAVYSCLTRGSSVGIIAKKVDHVLAFLTPAGWVLNIDNTASIVFPEAIMEKLIGKTSMIDVLAGIGEQVRRA